MAPNTLHLFISSLAFFASFARANSLEAFEKREAGLEKRDCDPGATLCGTYGLLQYCARPGYKCCDTQHIAPLSATCCPGGSYAPVGNYCCTNGRNCPNGRSCTNCTPTDGNGGFLGSAQPSAQPSSPATTTRAPTLPTTTRVVGVNAYYTFTITYYYYQWYYIYVPSITRSTPTSSTVTTTTTVSVYAANSAEARSSFSALSQTLSLPTPDSATVLPALPSQTPDFASPSSTTTSTRGANTASSSPIQTQFGGGAGRLSAGANSYTSFFTCLVVLAMGTVGFYVRLAI